ncbi:MULTISPECIES: DUF4382 domain-containing protein [Shewanella]|uniref:DUF4382 domain-containing protein n=1 Tax=Shewanella TaxID=22 RepID=UPI001D151853|nr:MULTISPECIES: DUF4382 domain-containing protein [Shewanella]
MKAYKTAILLFASLLITACGDDNLDTASSLEPVPESSNGQFSLAVSDSPMAGISHVVMVMSELVMTGSSGDVHRYDLGGMTFNLLDYQGANSHMVVSDIELPEGHYQDVHINVVEGDGNPGCYVENGQGRHGLHITYGHLPVEDFEIVAGQHHSMTLEIDLYRGLSHEQGEYQLHHDGMWSVDNRYMGHLLGEIDAQWIADCEAAHADEAPIGGQFSHLAYLYLNNVTRLEHMADMADMGATPPDNMTAPLAVTRMMQDSDGNWFFNGLAARRRLPNWL